MARIAMIFLWLALAWGLWSGHAEPLLVAAGIGSCLGVIALIQRLSILDEEIEPTAVIARLLLYLPWLLWQIACANVAVARVIWSRPLRIRPHSLCVPASQRSELGQAIYACSITLTPGTLSLDLRDGTIRVHALTDDAKRDLLGGAMDRRVRRVEGGA